MRKKDVFAILLPVVIVALLYLISCATPPPTKELADAEAAVAAATNQCSMCKGDWCQNVGKPDVEYCGYPCGDAELAAAQAALAKGKVLAGEFCHELEARRMLVAAKAYLVRQGVGPSRITTASGGETTQFAAGTSEDSFQLNRRAHFIPTQPSASAPGARIYFKFNDESKPAL